MVIAVYRFQKCERENSVPSCFTWRASGQYCSQKRTVILLFFRLNNSDKVSIIYSTNTSIFEKTLRHHWFDRTYIEQFFKLLKHSMKIQNTIRRTKEKFENKLYQFMCLAFHLQIFVKFIRKKFDFGMKQKIGLEGIKRYAPLGACIDELMKELLQEKIT